MFNLTEKKKKEIRFCFWIIKVLLLSYFIFLFKIGGYFFEFWWFLLISLCVIIRPILSRGVQAENATYRSSRSYYSSGYSSSSYSGSPARSSYTPACDDDSDKPNSTWEIEDYLDSGRDIEEYYENL